MFPSLQRVQKVQYLDVNTKQPLKNNWKSVDVSRVELNKADMRQD